MIAEMEEVIMVTIRRALYKDIPDIMRFMDKHWKPGNILATNREFFEWQFLDGDKLNMFIGLDEDNGKIYGMIGAVVYNRSSNPDISGCTWQVIKSDNPTLGLDLSEYMKKQLNWRYNFGAGLSKKAVRINKLMGRVVIEMDHYYRLADRDDYKIARIKDKVIPAAEQTGYSLKRIYSTEEMKQIVSEEMLAERILSKDYDYIENRYFRHPVFHYDIWKIADENGNAHSVLITRDEITQNRKVCEIIDHYGEMEDLGKIASALDSLMDKNGYEFVDVYSYGIPVGIYEKGGFVRCDENSANIIPNYFHPFVQENISLKLVDPMLKEARLFRGDGDQDRPC